MAKTARNKTRKKTRKPPEPEPEVEQEAPSAPTTLSDLVARPTGIVCPHCGCEDLRAVDGRPWEVVKTERLFGVIRRHRVCRHCGRTVKTRENIEDRK